MVNTVNTVNTDTDPVTELEIAEMCKRLDDLKHEAWKLEALYKKKLSVFQDACGKSGHEFVAEKDSDCINTRYYYSCKRCRYFTGSLY